MGTMLFTLLFVIAVSLDSFGIGCMIGLKKIQLSIKAVGAIAFLSGLCFLLSASIGHLLLPFVDAHLFESLGAMAFILLGLFFIWSNYRKPAEKEQDNIWTQPARILQSPEAADVDHSGGIHGKEVWLLGLALSLDTIGAGVSGVFIGIPPFFTAGLIFLMTSAMLYGGLKSGAKLSRKLDYLSALPGFLLIIIGLIKLV
ncbi:manganese efflux pump [Halobacillus sp. A1]|uniref:manganese efflux pump n=1 Tax=Halobacillus sp. A1 TaxID=2880262 RepID=UPI0020A6D900|nr:manganese efflux pump [Halobacillus sp. A1]MCP3030544.1 manganese efflux pump [Halobacillus sp. A1]